MPEPPIRKPQLFDVRKAIQQAIGFLQQGKPKQAERLCQAVLKLRPDHFDALHLLGVLRAQQGDSQTAVELISSALKQRPDSAEAHSDLGIALANLGRGDEAIASFDRALALKPAHVKALSNKGVALSRLSRHEDAIAAYEKALAIQPDFADAASNRGNALLRLNRFEEAIASYNQALALKPDHADALNNRGNSLARLGRYQEAVSSYEQALKVASEYKYAIGNIAINRGRICDWENHNAYVSRVSGDVRAGKIAVNPFNYLAMSDDAADQLACATTCIKEKFPRARRWRRQRLRYQHQRIHIAYLSADFHDHATAYLMAGLFEMHDREKFEITGISFGPDSQHEMRSRLIKGFDRFAEVRAKSDDEVASLLVQSEVDIAIDLKGFTRDARTGIFARGAAPIQVSYLGYPGTIGADFIDYMVADEFVIPREHQIHYTEKVVYLPDCYQVNDSKRKISERTPTRAAVGLPERGIVFCCFNNSYKLTPPIFAIWMRLLHAVEGSVLWLYQRNTETIANLRREAQARGVAPHRLIFASKVKLEDHLARHRLGDVFLDTLPYNAHTTASDALWAGLPVVTCVGRTFAGRVAGSLLHAVGLPELVTYTLEDYESLALKLATDEILLREIKEKLARDRLTKPLFDTDRFRRHIEAAYTTMWEIHQRGEEPRSFKVPPVD